MRVDMATERTDASRKEKKKQIPSILQETCRGNRFTHEDRGENIQADRTDQ